MPQPKKDELERSVKEAAAPGGGDLDEMPGGSPDIGNKPPSLLDDIRPRRNKRER